MLHRFSCLVNYYLKSIVYYIIKYLLYFFQPTNTPDFRDSFSDVIGNLSYCNYKTIPHYFALNQSYNETPKDEIIMFKNKNLKLVYFISPYVTFRFKLLLQHKGYNVSDDLANAYISFRKCLSLEPESVFNEYMNELSVYIITVLDNTSDNNTINCQKTI